jgi:hypothetical protein
VASATTHVVGFLYPVTWFSFTRFRTFDMENTGQPVSTEVKGGKKKSILLWVLGFIFIFAGIGTFATSIFGGVLMLLAGAISLPPTHSLIQEKLHIKL